MNISTLKLRVNSDACRALSSTASGDKTRPAAVSTAGEGERGSTCSVSFQAYQLPGGTATATATGGRKGGGRQGLTPHMSAMNNTCLKCTHVTDP